MRKTGAIRGETAYGLTSLDPARADATRLLTRQHWSTE